MLYYIGTKIKNIMENKKLKVCFFGIYNPEYSRNRVLMSGLMENGVEVIECRSDKKGLLKYFDLMKKHWKIRKSYNVLFVAFPGFQTMILAKFLTRKKIIFDCFAPLYESEVLDRGNTKQGSLKAKYYWWLDKFSARLADKVLLDTDEHIKYFVKEFGLNPSVDGEKFKRIFVGTSPDFFCPKDKLGKNNIFVVQFHGNYIPLQGVDYIMEAINLMRNNKEVRFNLIGSNIKEKFYDKNITNVDFKENVPVENLVEYISEGDICLGIFGDRQKTQRVIPNRIYECIACKKPMITADTPAIRELFNENDLYLISEANPQELVRAILKLKEDKRLGEKLAENAYNKLIQKAIPDILAKELIKIINE